MLIDLISEKLEQLISERKGSPHAPLFEAARYSLLSPGKRLRPLLALTTAEIFGAPLENGLLPACALEMVHTYSLIHDDLPCMDDDDLRRGRPTLHKVYDEGHAVLTGDYLLTYAFEVLAEAPGLTSEQKLQLIALLAQSAGADGMIGGQVVDLASEGKTIDWKTLQFMHLNKTAALITAAVQFGGIVASVSSEDMAALQLFGKHLGLAFQFTDDILDGTGSDVVKDKPTALTLLGLESTQKTIRELFASAKLALASLSRPAPALEQIASQLLHRTH